MKGIHLRGRRAAACLLATAASLLGAHAIGQPVVDEPAAATRSDNPAVEAILSSPREQPSDYARAVFLLIDLGEADLAAPLFDELLKLQIEDSTKAALVTQFSTARFLRLARTAELGPEAAAFATECLTAAQTEAVRPERLAPLIDQLGDDSKDKQAAALAALKRAGPAAVEFCLENFAGANKAKRNRLREALVAMGPLSRPALLAMLESPEQDLRKQAAWALGQLKAQRASPLLAARVATEPTGSDASRAAQWAFRQITGQQASTPLALRLLDGALRDVRGGVPPERPDAAGQVAVYQVPADAKLATTSVSMSSKDAGVVYASRLARARFLVDPSNQQARQTALVLDLQARALLEVLGVTPRETPGLRITSTSNSKLGEALAEALENRYAGAAAALCVAIGDRGDSAVLLTADSQPSPLAKALDSAHPAVRFAALRGVMGLAPKAAFPGSSKVRGALLDFARGGQARLAVVATPNLERSATIAGLLAGSAIEAQPTNRGAEAVQLAQSPDLEMVLLDLAVLRPHVRETLFQLRRQTTSALVPIGILAPDGRLAEAKRIATDHQQVLAFPRPHTAEAVADIAQALAEVTPAGWPTVDERGELAEVARDWIGEVLREGPHFYALRDRGRALQAALAAAGNGAGLAMLGTPASQLELLAAVNRRTEPIANRQAAAAAFSKSVEDFGVLLTTDQIQHQYDQYNSSKAADAETQAVLGTVLDVIESNRESPARR